MCTYLVINYTGEDNGVFVLWAWKVCIVGISDLQINFSPTHALKQSSWEHSFNKTILLFYIMST